jgi:hypothetical protein
MGRFTGVVKALCCARGRLMIAMKFLSISMHFLRASMRRMNCPVSLFTDEHARDQMVSR